MPILAAGVSQKAAPVELRERLAIPTSRIEEAYARLREIVGEGVILSTCNRTEVYVCVEHLGSGLPAVTHFLAENSGLPEHELAPYVAEYPQEAAVRHLFRVAAGLESMILGEGQILGQVARAYKQAAAGRRLGAVLTRLFDRALLVGKRARTETSISQNTVSVSQAAVGLARRQLGGLDRATVLLLGAGKAGQLAATALRQRGAARVILINRTERRAKALVGEIGGEAWPLARLSEALTQADVVITSTACESYVVTAARLQRAMCLRPARQLVVVDIAVPRNVEPSAQLIENVHLFNIDALQGLRSANLALRRTAAEGVESIVEHEVQAYIQWWRSREVAPTIAALVQRAETIRREELERALSRMGNVSEREANAVHALSTAIVKKLLHAPIVRLKERSSGLDRRHYLHAVRELFDLPATGAYGD